MASKAERRARARAKEAEYREMIEQRLEQRVVDAAPRRRLLSVWSNLPLPVLVRLCWFLPPKDLQRAAEVLQWNALQKTEVYRSCMRNIWSDQRE